MKDNNNYDKSDNISSKKNKLFSVKFKVLIMVLIVGVFSLSFALNISLAYFVDNDININTLKVGKIDIEINEDFDPSIGKKEVRITNPSKSPSFVRVSISGRWVNPNDLDEVLPEDDSLVTLVFADGFEENWCYSDDGYYYYKKELEGNATTEMLLEKVIFSSDIDKNSTYKGMEYRVEVKAEAVQSNKYINENGEEVYPYKEVWGIE
ncbi:hypothetical protein [uncultured Clostridium sp.]|uniref:hypothetical protein n=1 Tax=uncultured Clostridium sp. TaxID=59620 RepID=UPI0026098875|nr:hypothetical protein [uncultured Clostridium sp.]